MGYGCQRWTEEVIATLTEAGYIDGANYVADRDKYLRACLKIANRDRSEQDAELPEESGCFFGSDVEGIERSKREAEAKYQHDLKMYAAQESFRAELRSLKKKMGSRRAQ